MAFLFLRGFWGVWMAISSVTGSPVQGGALTIGGTSFGTKGTAAPVKFDNFASGSNGATVSNGWSVGNNGVGSGALSPTYSSAGARHGNSPLSARANFPYTNGSNYGYNSELYLSGLTWATNGIYTDGWVHLNLGGTSGDYSRNWKPFWTNTSDGGGANNTSVFYPAVQNPTQPSSLEAGILDQNGVNTAGGHSTFNFGTRSPSLYDQTWYRGVWRHIQSWQVQSSGGTGDNDGVFWLAIDNAVVVNTTTAHSRESSGAGSNAWAAVSFGAYLGHDADANNPAYPFSATCDFSDMYVDQYRQRVEIGDNEVYASCTAREIQIPTSWSDTAIGITVNAGAFMTLTDKFLFVVNSAGTATAGFALSGAETTAAGLSGLYAGVF